MSARYAMKPKIPDLEGQLTIDGWELAQAHRAEAEAQAQAVAEAQAAQLEAQAKRCADLADALCSMCLQLPPDNSYRLQARALLESTDADYVSNDQARRIEHLEQERTCLTHRAEELERERDALKVEAQAQAERADAAEEFLAGLLARFHPDDPFADEPRRFLKESAQ